MKGTRVEKRCIVPSTSQQLDWYQKSRKQFLLDISGISINIW